LRRKEMSDQYLNEEFETMEHEELLRVQEEKFLEQWAYVWRKSPYDWSIGVLVLRIEQEIKLLYLQCYTKICL